MLKNRGSNSVPPYLSLELLFCGLGIEIRMDFTLAFASAALFYVTKYCIVSPDILKGST